MREVAAVMVWIVPNAQRLGVLLDKHCLQLYDQDNTKCRRHHHVF
jgi:hypothetical protein